MAKKRTDPKVGPEKFRRGCLKGRLLFAVAHNLCKCEESCCRCKKCNQYSMLFSGLFRYGV